MASATWKNTVIAQRGALDVIEGALDVPAAAGREGAVVTR